MNGSEGRLGRLLRDIFVGSLLSATAVLGQQGDQQVSEDLVLTKARFRDPFLSRNEGPYLNYGWDDYEQYRASIPIFKSYDAFGNYLTEGYEVFRMEEFRSAPEDRPGSVVLKGRFYQNWMRHLIIAGDAYGGWSTRVAVGDAIRTTFTPLTLDMARFNGIRWDDASPNNRFTLVLSRLSDPVKLELKDQLGPGGKRLEVIDGLYLLGGHWESHVGDFLVLGATYLNLRRFDSTRGYSTNTRKGLAPPYTRPTQLFVRFQDDSPEDGAGGAMLYEVRATARIRESGKLRSAQILPTRTEVSEGVTEGARHLEASGRFLNAKGLWQPAYVDYVFAVPDSTVGVTIAAVVANDYRILIRQDHNYADPQLNRTDPRSTEFFTVRRAAGNVRDLSNKAQVLFEHGIETGLEIVGINADLQVRGVKVSGEVARSANYLQFTAPAGTRSDFGDFAAYATATKKLPGLSLGLEGFSIGPRYNTYATRSPAREGAEARPDLTRQGVPLEYSVPHTMGEPFFFNASRQDPVSTDMTEGGNKTNNPIYALVDDNDDMDQWPDDWVQDWDLANRDIKYLESDAGIFPFYDFDADGFPDNNRNRNQLADSDESFLMYFTDPREFYFGADANNNFLLDMWEDDDQPNYPYTKDERGFHATARFTPVAGLEVKLGRYGADQIAGGGRNEVAYGGLKCEAQLSRQWWLRFDHETKSVRDDIPNPYFDFRVQELDDGRLVPGQLYVPDVLDARDSFVNRGLVHLRFKPADWLNVNAKFRYELNHQREMASGNDQAQPADDLDFAGLLVKGDYTHQVGRFSLMPRLKAQYRRQARASLHQPFVEELMLAPILRLDYRLSARSMLRFGVQGLPLLSDRRIDFRDRDNDAKRQDVVLTWFNQSDYQGYKIGTEAGVEVRSADFDARGRSDQSFARYFVNMIAGVGTVEK
jgi:hypothetical protein